MGDGGPPKSGFAKLVPELLVEDLPRSCAFWQDVLGFEVSYQRREQKFVYMEHASGAQIMLCQRSGKWEMGDLISPFGRGVMFQISVNSITPVLRALQAASWPITEGPREVWRRWGDREGGRREIIVQDPDGYLVMLAKDLGERPL